MVSKVDELRSGVTKNGHGVLDLGKVFKRAECGKEEKFCSTVPYLFSNGVTVTGG